jgi:hypothetical protein
MKLDLKLNDYMFSLFDPQGQGARLRQSTELLDVHP